MGKRIIQQRRGRGTHTYKAKKKAFKHEIGYPRNLEEGKGEVVKLFHSSGHTSPMAKILHEGGTFHIPAFKGMYEGQKIEFFSENIEKGNIMKLGDLKVKTPIYNIESNPLDGGKFIRTGGSHAIITKIVGDKVSVLMPSKKEKEFNSDCRATVGIVAGSGRLEKPILKAGKQYHIKKSKNKLWPRTSAVKMNAIDHPFGSGRAKNVKSKIAKRNSSPGKKVGLLRPKRTGKKKK